MPRRLDPRTRRWVLLADERQGTLKLGVGQQGFDAIQTLGKLAILEERVNRLVAIGADAFSGKAIDLTRVEMMALHDGGRAIAATARTG
jgi:hypothetical protein